MHLTEPCRHISFRKEDFHVSFAQPFTLVFLCALTLSEVMFLFSENNSLQVLLLILPMVVVVLCTLAVAFMCVKFKFVIGPDGIDCYDFWGRAHQASWGNICHYQSVSLLGLDYLKIDIKGDRAIWLPLFVSRFTVLEELLETYTEIPLDD